MPKAVLCDHIGAFSDSLRLGEAPVAGTLPKGTLRVRVACAGLSFPDLLQVEGKYQIKRQPPYVPVEEIAGEVLEVSADIAGIWSIGDRVAGWAAKDGNGMLRGGLAEEALLQAASCQRVPEGVRYEAAVALARNYDVTYHALHRVARLQRGETLLVLGASGACGMAAIDLAKAAGACVIACASSNEKLEACRLAGADKIIDYESGGKDGFLAAVKAAGVYGSIDVVFDPVGGSYAETAFRALGFGGRFVIFGFAAGGTNPKAAFPNFPINLLLMRGQQILGSQGRAGHEAMQEMLGMVANGTLKPVYDSKYRLDDFRKAFEVLASRKAIGKVVVTIGCGDHGTVVSKL